MKGQRQDPPSPADNTSRALKALPALSPSDLPHKTAAAVRLRLEQQNPDHGEQFASMVNAIAARFLSELETTDPDNPESSIFVVSKGQITAIIASAMTTAEANLAVGFGTTLADTEVFQAQFETPTSSELGVPSTETELQED